MTRKRIVLITSGQPALNPRLVKEADALFRAGCQVTVIYAYWNDWGTEVDRELLAGKPWKAIRAGGAPGEGNVIYLLSRIIFKLSQKLNGLFPTAILKDIAVARSSYFLIRESQRHPADLYIGHNLGALPATVKAAKKFNRPCGFDAEDYHRHEMSDDANDADVLFRSGIEDKYLPQTDYFTASSTPIAKAYKSVYPLLKPVTIRNVFPKSEIQAQQVKTDPSRPLKLFWFSQVIGFQRGLENLIYGLAAADTKFELHLLGICYPDFKEVINAANIDIRLYPPIHPDEITTFAAQFDIGLALEPGFSINNNLALSNKIFTYMQAGLAVVASDTVAQNDLLDNYPTIGKVFPKNDQQALIDVLKYYDNHREQLQEARLAALSIAHDELNWEKESLKFLNMVNSLLAD